MQTYSKAKCDKCKCGDTKNPEHDEIMKNVEMPDYVKAVDYKLDKLIALTGDASSLSPTSPIDNSIAANGNPIKTDLLETLMAISFTALNRKHHARQLRLPSLN